MYILFVVLVKQLGPGWKTHSCVSFQQLFRVDPADGNIYVQEPLDSRRTSIVSYAIHVFDITPAIPQMGEGTVIINVKPFNTQPPVFEPYISPIYVNEEQPTGSVIITMIATDDNGIEAFEIIEQPDNFFSISTSTGGYMECVCFLELFLILLRIFSIYFLNQMYQVLHQNEGFKNHILILIIGKITPSLYDPLVYWFSHKSYWIT